jgi:hypothetical protein
MKPSALNRRLTDDQRRILVEDAASMLDQYQGEMATWYAKRKEYERQANADFSARVSGDPSDADREKQTIFDLSNESLNIVRNVTRFMKARCSEDIFGSRPWMSVRAVGGADENLAAQMNRHAPFKFDQAGYTGMGKEAVGTALDLGEAVIKTTHRTDKDRFERMELVLVSKASGKPIVVGLKDTAGNPQQNDDGTEIGDYIYPDDPTFTDAESGVEVYEKAPEIPVDPSRTEFREVLVEEETTTYHGLDAEVVRFDDFIAPLNIPTLDVADCVGHVFQRTVGELRALYGTPQNKHLFDDLETEPEGPKSAAASPRNTMGEAANTRQRVQRNPMVRVREVYLRNYDVFGEGRGRNIFMVLAGNGSLLEPIYVEYLANITARGKLPFSPVAVNRVPGRWYGRGFYELYEGSQKLIDRLINAIIYRNENNADPLTFWQPGNTEEGQTDKTLRRGPGKTITLRPGKTAQDAVQIMELPDLDERTWELVQLIMQLIQTDSGVTSAAQGDYSALPSASTATGVSSILQSASTLHRMLTEDLKEGFESAILLGLLTIYARQDADETFTVLEGDAAEVMSLANARTLAQLELNVQLLLTRFHMREQRESAQLVITQVLPAWMQVLQASGLPLFGLAASVQPLFIQVAKGTDIRGAEEIFKLPEPLPPPLPEEELTTKGTKSTKEGEATEVEPAAPVNVIPSAAAPEQAA